MAYIPLDRIWFFYSQETILAYWECERPVYFNFDKYERELNKNKSSLKVRRDRRRKSNTKTLYGES